MKARNIKSVCKNKIRDLCEHIDDEKVAALVRDNLIITGGCIASMLLREPVNDFDCYFRTREVAIEVARYFVNKFKMAKKIRHKDGREIECWVDESQPDRISIVVKSSGLASSASNDDYQYFETTDPESGDAAEYVETALAQTEETEDDKKQGKYRPVFMSTNAISLSHKVQLVTRFYGEPDQIHENYDFVHCTCYYTSWDRNLVLRPVALEALLARDLRYVGSRYPLCSLIRTRKFIQRGWNISAGQYLKMAVNLQQFNLLDHAVLKDQLTGVDAYYFEQVVKALQERNSKVVDTAYLVELIDRLF